MLVIIMVKNELLVNIYTDSIRRTFKQQPNLGEYIESIYLYVEYIYIYRFSTLIFSNRECNK